MMPFTTGQFLDVFAAYNRAVYPMQFVLVLMASVAIYLSFRRSDESSRFVSAILAFFWLWMGVVYHGLFFAKINEAAFLYGAFFVGQSIILLHAGFLREQLSFHFRRSTSCVAGAMLILYALTIYPLLGRFLGHTYPHSPTFGLPCPTTIFTFGILLWTDKRIPWYVLPIPFVWSLIGFPAAVSLGIREDLALPIAGLVTVLIVAHSRTQKVTNFS